VSEQAATLLDSIQKVVGTGGKTAKTIGQKLSAVSIEPDVLRTVRTNRTQADFDVTIPWSKDTFYRAGVFDVGQADGFNLQAGQRLENLIWARYGLHDSSLGAGLDFGSPTHPIFSMDLFGLTQPRLDARANLPIRRYLDITLGVDRAFDRPDPLFGLRYHN
jgi:hypothetical protein